MDKLELLPIKPSEMMLFCADSLQRALERFGLVLNINKLKS